MSHLDYLAVHLVVVPAIESEVPLWQIRQEVSASFGQSGDHVTADWRDAAVIGLVAFSYDRGWISGVRRVRVTQLDTVARKKLWNFDRDPASALDWEEFISLLASPDGWFPERDGDIYPAIAATQAGERAYRHQPRAMPGDSARL